MNAAKPRSWKKVLTLIIAIGATVALIASLVAYFLQTPRRLKERTYGNPAMAQWLEYFKVDVKTRRHPFQILRIVEDAGPERLSAECPFSYDFLVKQNNWDMGGPGKFHLVINGRVVSSGTVRGSNGNCLLRFDASELKQGANPMRLDILVLNPLHIDGWILAEGPSRDMILTNRAL